MDAVHDSPEVHAKDPLPVFEARLPHWPLASSGDARVVTEDVDISVRPERPLRELLDGLRPGDVCDNADHLVLLLSEHENSGCERLFFNVGEHDLHAFLGEPRGYAKPDAAGGA